MPLEATLLILDNSDYAVNSDYAPTRWEVRRVIGRGTLNLAETVVQSQMDALKTIFNVKLDSNPESVVGCMSMAGKSPQVHSSPTQNFGAIMSSLANVQLQGQTDLITAINVAQLALKHRQNKSQRQRVIAFVGSPLSSTSAADLVKLGKKMKKNNVAVDIVNFGEDAENEEKLREFVDAVNSSDNSHLVNVPAGTVLLSDMIMSSPMLAEDGVVPQGGAGGSGAGGSGAGAGGEDGDFGAVDPSLDPELAMALRMSLEEERARQQRTQEASTSKQPDLPTVQEGALAGESLATTTAGPSSETIATSLPPQLAATAAAGPPQLSADVTTAESTPAVGPTSSLPAVKTEEEDTSMEADEDADLAMALALSRGEGGEEDAEMDADGTAGAVKDEDEEMDEDEAIARAIAMSMHEGDKQPDK